MISLEEILEVYIQNKIDGICITEHNYLWNKDLQKKLMKQYKGKIKIFFGVEIDTDIGHVLAFGLNDFYLTEYIVFNSLLEKIDRKKTALIWAHPFRWRQNPYVNVEENIGHFDAIELYNGNLTSDLILKTKNYFSEFNVKFTGGSDTHSRQMCLKYATKFENDFETLDELIYNIKNSKYKPVILGTS
jgi:hypothetical protein